MYQAIKTKYLGPTNFRGSRIKASCNGGSIIVDYKYEWDAEKNHEYAALSLQAKMDWSAHHKLVGGSLKNEYVWVLVRKDAVV